MKIAITGGTGFVGRHLARALAREGHHVNLISRGKDRDDAAIFNEPGIHWMAGSVNDRSALAAAFAGCQAIAHCAGINREIGTQTYQQIHVNGTRAVMEAAWRSGVKKIVLLSFLRARPNCGSGYHESKWAAEEMIRQSKFDYTIVKAGVVYGRGDHMLHHLSQTFHTFPLFGLVGLHDQMVAPLAVADAVRVLQAALVDGRLSRETVSLIGPEAMTLETAVRRVGHVVGRYPLYVRLPLVIHRGLAWIAEAVMKTPIVSLAQVRILSEGVTEPASACGMVPADLLPRLPFTDDQIRQGLPDPAPLRLSDLRCAVLG